MAGNKRGNTSKHVGAVDQAQDWAAEERQAPRERESFEELFASQCRAHGLPTFERQLRFAADCAAAPQKKRKTPARRSRRIGRAWRFDFAFREHLVAVEIEGLVVKRIAGGELVVMGRHATITGIAEDMDKYNTAALLGWTVLRFRQADVKPKRALEMTMRVLAARGWVHG